MMKTGNHSTGNALFTLALALGCVLGLSACSTTLIRTAEQPPLRTGSPLKSIKPLTFCLKDFQDLRNLKPDLLFDVGGKKYKLDKPAAVWVRDSIRREFERNGHACVGPEGERKADVVIDGSLYEYSLDLVFVGFVGSRWTGKVGAKLSLSSPKQPEVVFAKKYDASFYASSARMTPKTVVTIQNEALLNLLKEIASDEEFLDFLRRQHPAGAREGT